MRVMLYIQTLEEKKNGRVGGCCAREIRNRTTKGGETRNRQEKKARVLCVRERERASKRVGAGDSDALEESLAIEYIEDRRCSS